jgi:flagellar export protein FliJ
MKRFDFRLERLLSVKKRLERLAEQRQQQARAEFDAAMAEATRARGRVEEASSGGLEMARKAATLGCWQARAELIASLERLAAAARERAATFLERLRAADLDRTRIASEVEAIEHLRERYADIHHTELLRRQYEQLDEIGLRRWTATAKEDELPREEDR